VPGSKKDPDYLSEYPADIRDLVMAKMVNRGTIPKCGADTSGGCAPGTCSDVRFKHSIVRLGTSPRGIPFYSFRYNSHVVDLDKDAIYVGGMAQDLIALAPEAVCRHARRMATTASTIARSTWTLPWRRP
jgi:hypothetical protein